MIAIVDYGAGNLRSVEIALDRLGIPSRRAPDPEGLRAAAGIILPGVGAAASAMAELEARGLAGALAETTRPLLGVCLGMQLLTERSDEGGSAVRCLGMVPGRTDRFRARVRLPQVGWNATRLGPDPLFDGLGRQAWFYFLHSHRLRCPDELVAATAVYGESFPAAIRRGRLAGVQFHPEKSGDAGLRVLANFWAGCRGNRDGGPC